MTTKLSLTLIALSTLSFGQAVKSEENFGSLTPVKYKSVFRTRTAMSVGDLITIIVSESSSASFAGSTAATKKDSNDTTGSKIPLVDFLKVGLLDTILQGGTTSASGSTTGSGTSTAKGDFTARMTAVVKQVLPNGTLLVEGTRSVKVNRDTQLLTLSGIIRVDDIKPDNTVLSENLANAEIKSEGIGIIYDRQRKGILTKILDWIF